MVVVTAAYVQAYTYPDRGQIGVVHSLCCIAFLRIRSYPFWGVRHALRRHHPLIPSEFLQEHTFSR